jgi:hypothetical protein
MSESAFFWEGIIRWPYWDVYWGPNRRTTSANSTAAFGGRTRGSTTAGPPSLEEAVGGLAQQRAELVPQRLGQVGVDRRGSQARMAEQDLDDADVHAPLEHVRGEAVTQRVRPEMGVEAAGVARLKERGSCGRIGQVSRQSPTGKEPPPAAMGFPDRAEHLEDRFGQRENTLLVSLADDAQDHLLRVDRGNGQRDRLGDPQSIGVDERETAAIDGLFQCGDQVAAVLVTADVGQPLPAWLADFFFVNRGQS